MIEWITAVRLVAPYGVCLMVGASVSGAGMSLLLEHERAQHRAEIAELRAGKAEGALSQVAQLMKQMQEAQASTQAMRDEQRKANENLQDVLRDLRTDTAGVRDSIKGMSQRFGNLDRGTLERYANACAAVFANLASRGEQLARRGAEIAGVAEGHYADDALKSKSWPRQAQHDPGTKGEKKQ